MKHLSTMYFIVFYTHNNIFKTFGLISTFKSFIPRICPDRSITVLVGDTGYNCNNSLSQIINNNTTFDL